MIILLNAIFSSLHTYNVIVDHLINDMLKICQLLPLLLHFFSKKVNKKTLELFYYFEQLF